MSCDTLLSNITETLLTKSSVAPDPILSLDELTLSLDLPLPSLKNPEFKIILGNDSQRAFKFPEVSNPSFSASHILDAYDDGLIRCDPKAQLMNTIREFEKVLVYDIVNEKANLSSLQEIVHNLMGPQLVPELAEEIIENNNPFTNTCDFDEFSGEFVGKSANLIDPKVKFYKPITLEDDLMNDPHLISSKKHKNKKPQESVFQVNSEDDIYKLEEQEKQIFEGFLSELKSDNSKSSDLFERNTKIQGLLSMTNEFLSSYDTDDKIQPFQKSQSKAFHSTLWSNIGSSFSAKQEPKKGQDNASNKISAFFEKLEKKDREEEESGGDFSEIEEEAREFTIEEENKLAESENRKFRIIRLGEKQSSSSLSSSNSNYLYAVEDNTDLVDFYHKLPKEKFAMDFPFELDIFQKRAILHLEQKESVFVAAHTSAGKTVVAEYAIAMAMKHKTRAIYTSPIKALSNQKYREFHQKFKHVGIITGDVVKNSDASCLIVTTEILRNMLYKGSDMVRDIEWVIFDEVHYVNNDERGVVWEETFIMLPEHIGIIMLSATVPNSMEFADWVGRTKNRKIYVQQTFKRPVPLEHSIYLLSKFHVIKEKEGPFLEKQYADLLKSIEKAKISDREGVIEKKRQQKEDKIFLGHWKDNRQKQMLMYKLKEANTKFIKKITPNDLKRTGWNETVRNLKELINNFRKNNMLPAVVFVFSKQKIKELTHSLVMSSYSLNTKAESGKITAFFNSALKSLKPSDRELPQFQELKEMLERGFAMHHGDILPLGKEIVEILFSDGLVKVLFATETFAMGINMPAKTVVFYGLKKHDGTELRWLKSSEYTQMSGRAGRRGLDEKGNVVLFMNELNWLPYHTDMKKIVDHKGESLQSKFKMTYEIILNLLTAKDIDVMEMMRRSFYENSRFSMIPKRTKQLKEEKTNLDNLSKFECPYRKSPLEEYPIVIYRDMLDRVRESNDAFFSIKGLLLNNQKINPPFYLAYLNKSYEIALGICLLIKMADVKPLRVLSVELQGNKSHIEIEMEDSESYVQNFPNIKDPKYRAKLVNIKLEDVISVFEDKVECFRGVFKGIDYQGILDFSSDLIRKSEGFSEDKVFIESFKKNQAFKPIQFKLDTNELQIANQNRKFFLKEWVKMPCHTCEQKAVHAKQLNAKQSKEQSILKIMQEIDENNLSLKEDYEGRFAILKLLNYIDQNNVPLIKARVAKEIGGDIYLCEVLMENVLGELEPAEIAAILSGFVNQFKLKKNSSFNLESEEFPDALHEALEESLQLARKIARLEQAYGLEHEDTEKIVMERLNFSLVKVVYEWSLQRDFLEICKLTEAQEGSIVKTIQRLEILLRDVRNAARIMGNMILFKKLEQSSVLIKRDIVFASSLYLES